MINDHETMRDRLDDYVDGGLEGREHRAVDAHLAACEECRRAVGELRELRLRARSLPRGIAPPRDLWEGIRARIEAPAQADPRPETPVIPLEMYRRAARPAPRRWAALAAAAVVLVVLSSTATALLVRGAAGPRVATLPPAQVAEPKTTSSLVAFRPAETEYRSTVQALETELQARRASLAPETVATIEANLRIIDRAIAEARAALEADPSDPDLPLHLGGVYRRKVELLSRAVSLPART